jgi:sugar lactone lactonase YvrE
MARLASQVTIQPQMARQTRLALRGNCNAASLFIFVSVAVLMGACSRPAQTATPSPPPPPFEYVDAWGSRGDGPGQFDHPVAMASDAESIIYVADAGSGFIHKFSANGEPRLSFQDDRFNLHLSDIAVDAGAAIYAADDRRGMVVIFFPDGKHHRQLRGGAPALTRESMHITVDSYGSIYVTAKRPFGVRRFSSALRLIGSWGGTAASGAAIENPSAVAIAPDGLVYVSESGQPQIKVFDAQGKLQRTLSAPADAGSPQFTGLAANAKYLFAVSASHPSVYVWALDGAYKLTGDLSGSIPDSGSTVVRKIVVTPAGDLLVLDTATARVFRFHLHL